MSSAVEVTHPVLTLAQATKLTDKIRKGAEEVWSLLGEAHDGRAWEPLNYKNFGAYVTGEFDLTKGQGYRLVNQAKVIKEISVQTGLPEHTVAKEVSGRAAETLGVEGAAEVAKAVVAAPDDVESRSAALRENVAAKVAEAKAVEGTPQSPSPLIPEVVEPEPPAGEPFLRSVEAIIEEAEDEQDDEGPEEYEDAEGVKEEGPETTGEPSTRDEQAAGTLQRIISEFDPVLIARAYLSFSGDRLVVPKDEMGNKVTKWLAAFVDEIDGF
jgi:hypothetical protein